VAAQTGAGLAMIEKAFFLPAVHSISDATETCSAERISVPTHCSIGFSRWLRLGKSAAVDEKPPSTDRRQQRPCNDAL